jgi:hypothetical protein
MRQPGDDSERLQPSDVAQNFSNATHLSRFDETCSTVETNLLRHIDECERAILAKMDANFRRVMVWIGLVFLATLGNIIKDFLR